MRASFGVELSKLRRQPAVWGLATVWLLMGVFFGYLLPYLLLRTGTRPASFSVPLSGMLPAAVVENGIQGFPLFGFALALVLGGLAVGGEYSWGTWTTVLVQRLARRPVLAGKLAALAVILLLITLASFLLAALCAVAVAALEGPAVGWPSAWTVLRGIGAGWLILVAGAALGVAGAVLLQGATLVVGLGVVYVSVVELLVGGFARQSAPVGAVAKVLPGVNAGSLASAFVPFVQGGGQAAPGVVALVPPLQATAVLAAYVIGLVGLAMLVFCRRDVTGAPGPA